MFWINATTSDKNSAYHSNCLFLASSLFFSILGISSPALGDDVDVLVHNRVLVGQDLPSVQLTVHRTIRQAHLTLKYSSDKVVDLLSGAIKAGTTHRFELPLAQPGRTELKGSLNILFADGATGEMPLSFDVEVVRPLRIDVPYSRLRLPESALQVRLSDVAQRCAYTVHYDDGEVVSGEREFAGEPPGTWLSIDWPALPDGSGAEVLKITLRCFDLYDFHSGLEIFPWRLAIAHEEVLFASGKADVDDTEAPKLDDALVAINQAIGRYGEIIAIKLYIVGHTDSVGDAATNLLLSTRRARAIATYFRQKGLRLPMFYAGLGESELLVPTPDETDEPRNRRADYVLAVDEPRAAPWHKL